ncbi:MAG: hypothetical protein V3T05_06130 [Myxococcota bacterium]
MTIRIAVPVIPLDSKRLAAVVTSAVVNPNRDDSRHASPRRAGSSWISWGATLAKPPERLD